MTDRKTAVLFPGKQNHWIIALPGATGDMPEREQAAVVWFQIFFGEPHEDIRVTGSQIGDQEKIRGNFIQKDFTADLPENTTFVTLAFDYLGERDEIEWPEDGNAQLWAVLQGVPTIHLKTPVEQELDTIGRTVDDIQEDASDALDDLEEAAEKAADGAKQAADTITSVVIAGGMVAAAVWLYGVFRSK